MEIQYSKNMKTRWLKIKRWYYWVITGNIVKVIEINEELKSRIEG